MDKIEKALRYANKGKIHSRITLFLVLVFCIGVILSQQIIEKDALGIIIISVIALAAFCLFVFLVRRIHSQNKFEKSPLAKKLAKISNAVLYEFISSIDYEIENELLIDYYDKSFKASLIITKKWFIFITTGSSVIRKTSELVSFKKCLHASCDDFHEFLSIKFCDGSYFSTSNCYKNGILDEVEKVFPELVSR